MSSCSGSSFELISDFSDEEDQEVFVPLENVPSIDAGLKESHVEEPTPTSEERQTQNDVVTSSETGPYSSSIVTATPIEEDTPTTSEEPIQKPEAMLKAEPFPQTGVSRTEAILETLDEVLFRETSKQIKSPKEKPKHSKLILIIFFFSVGFLCFALAEGKENLIHEMKMKQLDETKIPMENREVLPGDAEFEKELKRIKNQAERLKWKVESTVQNIKKMKKVSCLEEIPNEKLNKFVPDQSQFKGIEDFIDKSGFRGTLNEQFQREAAPVFQRVNGNQMTMQLVGIGREEKKYLFSGKCVYKNEETGRRIFMKNGTLYLSQESITNGKQTNSVRVYYIPPKDLFSW